MKISKNDVLEIVSGLLLVMMVAISFTYEKRDLLSVLMLILCIAIFSMITYFSMNEKERELGLIKCECMLFCLFLMIYLYYQINMMIPLIVLFILLFLTTSKEMKKHE